MKFVNGEYTEYEAILLSVKYGTSENKCDGSELETSLWKDRGYLKVNGTYHAFIDKLNSIFEHVEVINVPRKPKERKYILSGLKSAPTAREKMDRGRTEEPEDIIMKQYFFNCLLEMSNGYMDFSLNGWAKQVGLLDVKDIPTLRFERRISELHEDTPYQRVNPAQAVNTFKRDTIYSRNRQVIENSLKNLKKSNHIDYIKKYNVIGMDNKRTVISEELYKEIRDARTELLGKLDSNITAYNNAIGNPSPTKKMKDNVNAVSKMLNDKYDAKFIYESYEVVSVNVDKSFDVTKEGFMEAYWDRLITLTESRQKRYDNEPKEKQTWFWKKFYLINTLTILDYMGIDTGDIIEQAAGEINDRALEISVAYRNWENRDRPVGFGGNSNSDELMKEIEDENMKLFGISLSDLPLSL